MSGLLRHPGRAVTLALAAVVLTALALNGPVAAGESAASTNEPAAVVSEIVGDVAPMVEPMEDVQGSEMSDASGDAAPMVEPVEDVDE
jgi:hypothetical protein